MPSPALPPGFKWPGLQERKCGAPVPADAGGCRERSTQEGRMPLAQCFALLAEDAPILGAMLAQDVADGGEFNDCMGRKYASTPTRDLTLPCISTAPWLKEWAAGGPQQRRRQARLARAEAMEAEATRLLEDFCTRCPAMRIAPSDAELQALGRAFRGVPRQALSKAFHNQLSYDSGDTDWQPRCRALHALAHWHAQGGEDGESALKVAVEAQDLLRHLAANFHQCEAQASYLLDLVEFDEEEPRLV